MEAAFLYPFFCYLSYCSSIELLLERLCLEGTRKQAKYAVQAIAAITKDDGLKSLSVLYKVALVYFMETSFVMAAKLNEVSD